MEYEDALLTDETGARRSWVGLVVRVLGRLVLGLGVLAVLAFFYLTRAPSGQRLVLGEVMGLLEGTVNGSIRFRDLRSPDLMEGVGLYGLTLDGPDGRPFLAVDSLYTTYAWDEFLAGDVVLTSLTVYGLRLRVARDEGEERTNADVILGGDPDDGASEGPRGEDDGDGRRIVLRDVRLEGGIVEILEPAGEAPEPRTVVVDDPVTGTRMRRISFEDLRAVLPRLIVSSPTTVGTQITVESLGLTGYVFDDPLRVVDLAGVVAWTDGRVAVDAQAVELPSSRLNGRLWLDFGGEEGLELGFDGTTPGLALEDVRWAEPRLPDGTLVGDVRLVQAPDGLSLSFADTRTDMAGGGRVTASGTLSVREEGLTFDGLDLDMAALPVDRLRPWSPAEIPFGGRLGGPLSLDGSLRALRMEGRVTLVPTDTLARPTTADVEGTAHLEGDVGVTDFTATLDPFDYELLGRVRPALAVEGTGRVRVEATGRLADGVRFDSELDLVAPGAPRSRVLARGSVRREGEESAVLDVQADLSPLSFTALRRGRPELPVSGEVRGTVRARGLLEDLRVTGNLDTRAGRLTVDASFDALDPGRGYRLASDMDNFALSVLFPDQLPDPSYLNGTVNLTGRGLDPDSLTVQGDLSVQGSRLGSLDVDTAAISFRISEGSFTLDTLTAMADGLDVQGRGRMAVTRRGTPGELELAFRSESMTTLRPLLLGDTVIARDTLTALQRELLEFEGVDADTLPDTASVSMGGRLRGRMTLSGSLESFGLEGSASFEELRYGSSSVRGAELRVSAEALPSLEGPARISLVVDSAEILERSFSRGELEVEYLDPEGRFDLTLARTDDEDYRARARFEVDSIGGRLDLEALTFRFDTLAWNLEAPSTVAWDDERVRLDELVVRRPGSDSMRIRVDGVLPRRGEADFVLDVDGVQLERLAQIAQREDLGVRGRVDLSVEVLGTAAEPLVTSRLRGTDLTYDEWELSRVEADLDYRDLVAELDLRAWRDDLQVLSAVGSVPADLSLRSSEDRFPPDRAMDVAVRADSLPAIFVVGMLENLDDVEGTVSADFRIGGTVEDPSPSGTLTLADGAWTFSALGVRQRDVQATLSLQTDGTVQVDARGRSRGTVEIDGVLDLDPLSNPSLDLEISLNRFLAVDRRDVTGSVSGDVTLTGTYRRPVVRGLESNGRGLRVDEGILFLEEFQRASTVIDLSDPRLFGLVSEAELTGQPILTETQNPFLRNLLVEVDLAVDRNTWLRSPDMNVEMRGDLLVTYDRQSSDLVLVGTLQAVRGSYAVLGRNFEVAEGTVDFAGTPGLNPNLDITAETRVRRPGGEPLDISASVTGTLSDPRVDLSSEEQAVAESDLVSYLIFGRPSYELASGQAQALQGAAGSLLGATAGAGLSVLSGTLTNRLSSLVAQQWGLDYFSITQPGDLGLTGGAGAASLTSVEVGYYLTEELFGVLVVRPLWRPGGAASLPFGARLEWQATDLYRIEAFLDDRFLRSGAFGFQELGFRTSLVGGFSLFREWSY